MPETACLEVRLCIFSFYDNNHSKHHHFLGRTNASILYKKAGKNERIDYLDICSLYPSVSYIVIMVIRKFLLKLKFFRFANMAHSPWVIPQFTAVKR